MRGGKGAGDYGLLARGDDIASVASFYGVLARYSDGKWEKTDATTMGDLGADTVNHVRAKVRVPADALVVSSGVVLGETSVSEADAAPRKELEIAAAFVRDFSMLVSRRFESSSRKVGDVEVRSHFLGRDRAAGERVLDSAAASLGVYEKLFGRYPYVDLDVVEAPLVGGAGGVEFSGLVTVASMLYRPALSEGPMGALLGLLGGPSQKEVGAMTDSMLEFVTAHEVAHQYFPGLVGSDSRAHPWMDESLAQWSAVMYVRDRYGPERAKLEAEREILANYQTMRLMGVADGAVDRPVDAFGGELGYAGLVYGKGPYLFRELEKTVGEKAFREGLRRYVERHRFRAAPPRSLVEELAKGDQADRVRELAKRWLDEKHGDEDLGKPDIRQLLAGWIGEDAVKNMGPELDMAMKLMLKLMGPDAGGSDSPLQLLDLLAPKQ
jgi:aminopeptidase N